MNHGKMFRKKFKRWILQQIETGQYKDINTACETLAQEVLGLNSGKTIKNYYYGQRYPVSAKHVPKLSRLTGIEKYYFNPEAFG